MINRSKKTIAILLSLLTISSVTYNAAFYKPVYAAESSNNIGITYTEDQITTMLSGYLESYLKDEYSKKYDDVYLVKIDITKSKTIPIKSDKISEITLYGYGVLNSKMEMIGKGYIVGGKAAYALKEAGKDPIYIQADKLDLKTLEQLKSILEEKIHSIEGKIDGILSDIKGTIGGIKDTVSDLSDSLSDLSDSLNDKSDDVDDAWDKVFDRFDNDEGWGKRDGYIYYYDEDGISLKGVQKIDGKRWCYGNWLADC